MNCVDCQTVLAEYSLDALGPRESQEVAEHLAGGCAACRQSLNDVREAWGALADTLQPASPPPQLKADLLARLHAEREPSAAGRVVRSPAATSRPNALRTESRWRWQAAIPYIAATLFGIAIGFWFERSPRIDSGLVARYHAQLQQAERTFAAPEMRFASLHVPGDRPEVHGYLIWDGVAGELHVYAFNLMAPAGDKVYRLWFVADDETWIPVGDLDVGPDGVCSAVVAAPALQKPVSRIVVTTEPRDGASADATEHGPIDLRGEFL